MKLYALLGYEEDWGAKHYRRVTYAPEEFTSLLLNAGAKHECSCHYPCEGQLGGEGRYSFTLLSLEAEGDRVEIPVPPHRGGREGYDVSLLDPWEADPKRNYEVNTTTSEAVVFTPSLPSPCCRCNGEFRCTCNEYFSLFGE